MPSQGNSRPGTLVACLRRGLLEEGLDLALESLFVYHADVKVRDFAVAIDEQRCRHRIEAEAFSHITPIANHNRIINFMFLKEWLDGFPAIIVQGHANGGKPALFVF